MKQRRLTPMGKRIVKRLIDMDKTQKWLCEQIGTHKQYLTKILYGERSGEKYLKKIYEVLNLSEDEQKSA